MNKSLTERDLLEIGETVLLRHRILEKGLLGEESFKILLKLLLLGIKLMTLLKKPKKGPLML